MKTIIDFTNKVKSLVNGRISNIANVEESPSTHAYAVGKQLIFNGLLCKATSTIAVGDTLAVGTNLALSDNVVEQIYSLNQGLTNSLNEIADMNNVLGAKNFINVTSKTSTYNGLTFTINADNSVTVNGTATVQSYFSLSNENAWDLKAGNYIINGCPSGGSTSTFELQIRTDESDSSLWIFGIDFGNGANFNIASDKKVKAYIGVQSGVTVTNKTFYPMLRLASIQDDTYVPYSMTNREITPYVQSISNPNLLDNPWFTVNQRGQSSYSNLQWKYTVDRFMPRSNDAFSVTDDGLKADTSNGFALLQRIEKTRLAGKANEIFTLSILLSTGEIFTASGTAAHSFSFSNERVEIEFYNPGDSFNWIGINIFVYNNTDVIRAAKFELGSVSTLSMDSAPNYQQELAKCQRYFQRISIGTGQGLGYGVATSTTTARIVIPLTVPLRDAPTISISNADQILINGSSHTISKMEFHGYRSQNNFITVTVTTTGLTNEQVCILRAGNTAETLEISADL